MEDKEHLRRTLEHYRQQRQRKLEELRPIDMMIRQLELDLGEQPTVEESAPGDTPGVLRLLSVVDKGLSASVRPDEFYNMTQGEAAKAYLRKVKHAIPFDELVTALRSGGATLGGADPKRTLYVSLARNPKKEFVWPQDGYISLDEFYPRNSAT